MPSKLEYKINKSLVGDKLKEYNSSLVKLLFSENQILDDKTSRNRQPKNGNCIEMELSSKIELKHEIHLLEINLPRR